MSGDACMPRRIPFGVRPTASFSDIVKTPPKPCVFRQQVETLYSASTTCRGRANPSGQCEPLDGNDTQSFSPICS
jgi:hypothetical protein